MILNYHENYSLIEREILLKKRGGGKYNGPLTGHKADLVRILLQVISNIPSVIDTLHFSFS